MRKRLALVLAATVLAGQPPPAAAESSAELTAARNLFAEALRDEDAKRYDLALEKYRRVQAVRDTAPIRYRIGSCHEGLGQLAQALAAYRASIELGQKDKGQEEVARAARGRIDAIWKRVPQLTLVVQGRPLEEVTVRLDDRVVSAQALREPVYVDPGEHVITATAPGAAPFRTTVFLPERGRVSISVPLEASSSNPVSTPVPATGDDRGNPPAPSGGPSSMGDEGRSSAGQQRLFAGIGMGVGAAAMVAGGIFLGLRASEIGYLNRECAAGCPPEKVDELNAARDRALTYGPLGGALLAGGAVAVGVSAYFFFTAKDAPKSALLPYVHPLGAGAHWVQRF